MRADIRFSEIMYRPVEEPVFDAAGFPVLDLSEEVHEYIELHNTSASPLSLADWRITGGVEFTFPPGAAIPPDGYIVVAKNPALLAKVAAYNLVEADIFGPWTGQLSNKGETLKLKTPSDKTADTAAYSSEFPWPIGANAFGAGRAWTKLSPLNFQYRGCSLERISFAHSGEDPANWAASPIPGEPSPGKPNTIQWAEPRPIVTQFSAVQASDGQPIIRATQPVRIECLFSAVNNLSDVKVEYFVDNINSTTETKFTAPMEAVGTPADGRYSAVLPVQAVRSVVRYRFLANRGAESEVVSPRPGDPYLWHAYFVSPVRSGTNPVYDLFISTASLARLSANLADNPNSGFVPKTNAVPNGRWNLTEPGIFVYNGVVRDVQTRYNGSYFRRSVARQSYKVEMPRYNDFDGQSSILITDKDAITVASHFLFREAGLPTALTRWVDLYVNSATKLLRLEIEEHDDHLLERYHKEQAAKNHSSTVEQVGRIFKSSGILDNVGPYGRGDGSKLPTNVGFTPIKRYEWIYSSKSDDWAGYTPFKDMIDKLAVARGSNPAANVAAMRQYFLDNWDVNNMLTYTAVRNWMATWDDTVHNFYLWRNAAGKWCILPWDFDADMNQGGNASSAPTVSIFRGEANNADNTHGTHVIKDSFFKAFRQEYKERLFWLNNTLLHPDNLKNVGLTYDSVPAFSRARLTNVNKQVNLGVFHRPNEPIPLAPLGGESVLPGARLRAGIYSHTATPAVPHATTTWRIRADTGNWSEPLYSVTVADNLTSFPIPFDKLEFGGVYYWQCIYTDSAGRPSVVSEPEAFQYGGTLKRFGLFALGESDVWRFDDSGAAPNPAWRSATFDDSAWKSGVPLFGKSAAAMPVPFRTEVAPNRIATYFRRHFTFAGDPKAAKLRVKHLVDDGLVLYLNGTEILRTNMAVGTPLSTTLANKTVVDASIEGPFNVSAAALVQGDNVLAAEVHQATANNADIVFGVTLDSTFPVSTGEVVLNEALALNKTAVSLNDRHPDYVELFNPTEEPQSMEGMTLTDDPLDPAKFRFPPNTVMAPKERLLVWCDSETGSPGLHAGFGLNADGQTIALFAPSGDGLILKDSLVLGLQTADFSVGRVPDGTGSWQLNQPSPAGPNVPQPLGDPANLVINEWLADPSNGNDWLEIHNRDSAPVALGGLFLTDTVTQPMNTKIAPLSFVGPGGFQTFFADGEAAKGPSHLNFKLGANGETIAINNSAGGLLNKVVFGKQARDVSQGRLPDGSANIVSFGRTPTPGESNYLPLPDVRINEVLLSWSAVSEPAIELFNDSPDEASLGGWWLSDIAANFRKFAIPAGVKIAPYGYRVFYEPEFAPAGAPVPGLVLEPYKSAELYLSETDASGNLTGRRSQVRIGVSEPGVSWGYPQTGGATEFLALAGRTFGAENPSSLAEFETGTGAANSEALVGPVVIGEIMYHPADRLVGTNILDNAAEEFVELHNFGETDAPLFDSAHPANTWKLANGTDFTFPAGVVLKARGFLVVAGFDPADEKALARFRASAGVPPGVPVFGPFAPKLDNSGETLELLKPGPPSPGGLVPYVLADKVRYADGAPWPSQADGFGFSLQRVIPEEYADDPANWRALPPTAGYANAEDSDGDGLPDAWELANHLNPADPSDAALDADGDGWSNLEEFQGRTDPTVADNPLRATATPVLDGSNRKVALSFRGMWGRTYRVESKTSLADAAWSLLGEFTPSAPSQACELLDEFLPSGTKYYRIVASAAAHP